MIWSRSSGFSDSMSYSIFGRRRLTESGEVVDELEIEYDIETENPEDLDQIMSTINNTPDINAQIIAAIAEDTGETVGFESGPAESEDVAIPDEGSSIPCAQIGKNYGVPNGDCAGAPVTRVIVSGEGVGFPWWFTDAANKIV